MFIAGLKDMLFTRVNDTGDKFIASDNYTGEQLSPVTTTPAINLLTVTRTRTPWRWGAAKDRRKLKGTNRWYLRPPKSGTAADGAIGTAIKSCIQRHFTTPEQRPLRPPKLNIFTNMKKTISQNFFLLSLVSLTLLININSRISPRIFEKIWNGLNGILRDPGITDLWKKT